VHVSLPWASIEEPPPESELLAWSRRPVDWGMSRVRSRLQHITTGLRLLRNGRHEDTIIVCHTGMHAVTAGLAHSLISRSTRLVVVDFLLPKTTPRWVLRTALRGVNEFVVIRSGDTQILARLGVPTDRCRFVAFAAPTRPPPSSTDVGEYVYSGGAAQRDWATLADALGQSGIPALVSCPDEGQRFTNNVLKLPLVRPDQGRKFLSGSRFLVQAIIDNDQPSGPLLILDAFSAGKPVVATDVNGTRDYVEHDVNGVLVPPHDPAALANAISALYSDVGRIARMADAARGTASALSSSRFWREVLGPYVDTGESQKDMVPD
jgi:Glycosyl transferases group 1